MRTVALRNATLRSVFGGTMLLAAACPEIPLPLREDAPFRWGAYGGAGLVELDDRGEIPWSWGFQGGTMIRPTLILDPENPWQEGDEVELRLRHLPDPDAPAAFRVEEGFVEQQVWTHVGLEDQALVLGPIDDQLGVGPLAGIRLLLELGIPSLGARFQKALRVVDDPFAPPLEVEPCLPYAPELGVSGGCVYAEVVGQVQLSAVASIRGEGCGDDLARLSGRFIAPDVAAETCMAASFVADALASAPERLITSPRWRASCLEGAAAVAAGRSLAARLEFIVQGTCTPGPDLALDPEAPEVQALDEACACPADP